MRPRCSCASALRAPGAPCCSSRSSPRCRSDSCSPPRPARRRSATSWPRLLRRGPRRPTCSRRRASATSTSVRADLAARPEVAVGRGLQLHAGVTGGPRHRPLRGTGPRLRRDHHPPGRAGRAARRARSSRRADDQRADGPPHAPPRRRSNDVHRSLRHRPAGTRRRDLREPVGSRPERQRPGRARHTGVHGAVVAGSRRVRSHPTRGCRRSSRRLRPGTDAQAFIRSFGATHPDVGIARAGEPPDRRGRRLARAGDRILGARGDLAAGVARPHPDRRPGRAVRGRARRCRSTRRLSGATRRAACDSRSRSPRSFAVAAGVVVAPFLAIVASPLVRTGFARAADPDRGIWVDGRVLALASFGLVLLFSLFVLTSGWRAARSLRLRPRPDRGRVGFEHRPWAPGRAARLAQRARRATSIEPASGARRDRRRAPRLARRGRCAGVVAERQHPGALTPPVRLELRPGRHGRTSTTRACSTARRNRSRALRQRLGGGPCEPVLDSRLRNRYRAVRPHTRARESGIRDARRPRP